MAAISERRDALHEALARLAAAGPRAAADNKSAPFKALIELCGERYLRRFKSKSTTLGLGTAIQALGFRDPTTPVDVPAAADRLDRALRIRSTRRLHICPLDRADDFPDLNFGRVKVRTFTPAGIAELFAAPRLRLFFPKHGLETSRLSQFTWLTVEERVRIDPRPDFRAYPFLGRLMSEDFGRIEPHKIELPDAVRDTLAFLLLAPWEDIASYANVDWRGFSVPWHYTVDQDLFVSPRLPPSADSLSWDIHVFEHRGKLIEHDVPMRNPLHDEDVIPRHRTRAAWKAYQQALASPLFETPITHFLVRAMRAQGIDEFLAHITAIEAAVGQESDYFKKQRPPGAKHGKQGPTWMIAARLLELTGDPADADDFFTLFELRSTFLHGRGMADISSDMRVRARRLARKVIEALVRAAPAVLSRSDYLDQLVAAGGTRLSQILSARKTQANSP